MPELDSVKTAEVVKDVIGDEEKLGTLVPRECD
jgi:hypothetical protein